MCFDHYDADWSAEVHDVTEWEGGPVESCCECGRQIGEFDYRRRTVQREHEVCQFCDGPFPPDLDCPDTCGPGGCEFGERFTGYQCRDCVDFLLAVELIEVGNGCPPWATQPIIGTLMDSVTDHHDRFGYVQLAVDLYPNLWKHPLTVAVVEN